MVISWNEEAAQDFEALLRLQGSLGDVINSLLSVSPGFATPWSKCSYVGSGTLFWETTSKAIKFWDIYWVSLRAGTVPGAGMS